MKDLAKLSSAQRARLATLLPVMRMIGVSRPKRVGIYEASRITGFSKKRLESLYYAWLSKGDQALVDGRKLTKSEK